MRFGLLLLQLLGIGALGSASSLLGQTILWDAGADLASAEQISATETANPNAVAPLWSYGFRSTLLSSDLSLFRAEHHFNSGTYSLEGFSAGANLPYVAVNTGAFQLSTVNHGFGALYPVSPSEMLVHPPINGDVVIVRWTAPTTGQFKISAYWRDVDPYGGNGGSGDVVINGISMFSGTWANGAAQINTGQLFVSLNAGDVVDFATGSLGEYTFDSTAFNATITTVPEPSTLALFALGSAALWGARQNRRRRSA